MLILKQCLLSSRHCEAERRCGPLASRTAPRNLASNLVMHLFPEPTFSLTFLCFQNRIASQNSCFENWTLSRTRAPCRAYNEALLRFHVAWLTLDEPRTHPRNEWLALCHAAPKVSLLQAARPPPWSLLALTESATQSPRPIPPHTHLALSSPELKHLS